MLAFDALVRGRVTESSQGVAVVVPRGRCKVETHEGIVSLSWINRIGGTQSVVLTAQRFEEHLEAGAILIVDAAQICQTLDVRTP